ncbi:hypothetical protein [Vibrio lentus]|uniref:Uncharacterized protein n=1 Tax=Vibrio lentus TaxID=136468 RepID=A0A2N7BIR5_9VIBR|nr:hypothetical protein [Vibrio lentus]PME53727.1 hypothetical protein BCV34_22225 [Vibrio lentus]PME56097.1 hypothetical protein BCV30_19360 [Vibrio lentus]PME81843.1 hypothetical protein BCV27_14015 [Vibrio lentus]PMI89846.1 hypothetical protein BCU35_22845 [Vibrio lentus]
MIAELTLPTGEVLINVPSEIFILMELGFTEEEAMTCLSVEQEKQQLEEVMNKRKAAYRNESDPLFMEWQFDGTSESEALWKRKVEEIKARYPLPSGDNAPEE